jgi:hypothetical protein
MTMDPAVEETHEIVVEGGWLVVAQRFHSIPHAGQRPYRGDFAVQDQKSL